MSEETSRMLDVHLSAAPALAKALGEALADAQTSYRQTNPKSLEAYENACQYMPGGNTRTILHALPFPLTYSHGHDSKLVSLDGHTYTDFLGEYTAGIYGHNNREIRAGIELAMDKGWSFGGTNTYEKELAKVVCERFRPTMELVRFTNSGTEANTMAVALAVAWTGRKKVLVFGRGYHGATLSFQANQKSSRKSVNMPHEWIIGAYNDIDATKATLAALPSKSLAAILVEPMQGSGGAIAGDVDFLNFLRSYATMNGALLILDEVMTSRLAYRGLGYELGIHPDLMTLGKWVGGGMTFGAFGGRKDVMSMFDPRTGSLGHAGTFNNNVISMAAGCVGCRILNEETIHRLNALGETMKRHVNDIIHTNLLPSESKLNGKQENTSSGHLTQNVSTRMWISGIGSILAIHFADSPTQTMLHSLLYHHMLVKRIYIAERGFLALNIELNREDVNNFATAMGTFVTKYRNFIMEASSA